MLGRPLALMLALGLAACAPAPDAPPAAPATRAVDAPRAPRVAALTVYLPPPDGAAPAPGAAGAADAAIAAALAAALPDHRRVETVPAALEGPVVLVRSLDRTSLQPPDPGRLRLHSPGASAAALAQVAQAERAVALVVLTPGDGPTLAAAVAAADRAGAHIARATGGLVVDDDTLQLLDAAALEARATAGVLAHSTVRVAPDGAGLRAVSLGLGRYGCPELVLSGFSAGQTAGVRALLDLVRQSLVERPGLPTGERLVLDIAQLADAEIQAAQLGAMLPGATGQATVGLRWPQRREDDPENALLEIVPEPDLATVLLALYGTERPGPDLVAQARDAARAELFGPVRDRFAAGLPPDARLLVKGPFAARDGGTEWMWVAVERWEDAAITGVLTNTPHDVPGLHEGATVTVAPADVFDFLYVHPDGRTEGNRTGALLDATD